MTKGIIIFICIAVAALIIREFIWIFSGETEDFDYCVEDDLDYEDFD